MAECFPHCEGKAASSRRSPKPCGTHAPLARRAKCAKGFFVSFDFSSDALREIQRFFVEEQRIIIPVTVQEILDEQIAHKLA